MENWIQFIPRETVPQSIQWCFSHSLHNFIVTKSIILLQMHGFTKPTRLVGVLWLYNVDQRQSTCCTYLEVRVMADMCIMLNTACCFNVTYSITTEATAVQCTKHRVFLLSFFFFFSRDNLWNSSAITFPAKSQTFPNPGARQNDAASDGCRILWSCDLISLRQNKHKSSFLVKPWGKQNENLQSSAGLSS